MSTRKQNVFLFSNDGRAIALFRVEDDDRTFALNRRLWVCNFAHMAQLRQHPGMSRRRVPLNDQSFLDAVVESARLLHEGAIKTGDMGHIEFTWQQFCHVLRLAQLHEMGLRIYYLATLQHHQQAGEKSRGVTRKNGYNWEEICRTYDSLIDQGDPRARVTAKLTRKYNISKDVLARGLRNRKRGRSNPT